MTNRVSDVNCAARGANMGAKSVVAAKRASRRFMLEPQSYGCRDLPHLGRAGDQPVLARVYNGNQTGGIHMVERVRGIETNLQPALLGVQVDAARERKVGYEAAGAGDDI